MLKGGYTGQVAQCQFQNTIIATRMHVYKLETYASYPLIEIDYTKVSMRSSDYGKHTDLGKSTLSIRKY